MKHYEKLLEKGCFTREQLIEIAGTAAVANNIIYDYQTKGLIEKSKKRFSDFEYDGVVYCRGERKPEIEVIQQGNMRITSMEQTVVVSIRDFEKIAGSEEVIRCMMLVPGLNEQKVLTCLARNNNGFFMFHHH